MGKTIRTIVLIISSFLIMGIQSFIIPSTTSLTTKAPTLTSAYIFGKKKPQEDLSSIESRDLTREEMLEINKQNEDVMNMELTMMTLFSLVLSLPIFYLCWVAFYSE